MEALYYMAGHWLGCSMLSPSISPAIRSRTNAMMSMLSGMSFAEQTPRALAAAVTHPIPQRCVSLCSRTRALFTGISFGDVSPPDDDHSGGSPERITSRVDGISIYSSRSVERRHLWDTGSLWGTQPLPHLNLICKNLFSTKWPFSSLWCSPTFFPHSI
jgi:hypothetical protein